MNNMIDLGEPIVEHDGSRWVDYDMVMRKLATLQAATPVGLTKQSIEVIRYALNAESMLLIPPRHKLAIDNALRELEQLATPVADAEGVQPDWSKAPEWAQWWTVNPTGLVSWSETEPVPTSVGFGHWDVRISGARWEVKGVIDIPLGIDWRTLKQRRPHAQQDSQEEVGDE